VTYKFKPATIYASYATGYKPGGFNSSFEEDWQLQFEKEMSHNYELGIKAKLFNGLIYTDLAYFYSQIRGQQINRSLESGRGTYLDNTGESRNQGFEISLNVIDYKGFEVKLGYGYTHALIQKYELNDTTDYDGNISPFVPKHTFSIMLAKTFRINSLGIIDRIRLQTDFQQLGEMYWDVDNERLPKQESYGLLNARISFLRKDHSLEFWARNLLDSEYYTYMFMIGNLNSMYGQHGSPREFGVTLSMKF
jgi:outer membrane receptor protein involved in Fe transport